MSGSAFDLPEQLYQNRITVLSHEIIMSMNTQQIYEKVGEHYSFAASSGASSEYGRKVATAFGYTEDELVNIPQDANLGLSCGNPLALAKLKEVCRIPFDSTIGMLNHDIRVRR